MRLQSGRILVDVEVEIEVRFGRNFERFLWRWHSRLRLVFWLLEEASACGELVGSVEMLAEDGEY